MQFLLLAHYDIQKHRSHQISNFFKLIAYHRNYSYVYPRYFTPNKTYMEETNLRDLITATGLVILLKLDSNCRFFSPCDLEIWWMTPKNNRAPLLCYFKLFASFRSLWWIHTGVSLETPNLGQNRWFFFSCVTLQFDRWPWKTIGHLFYATSSFVYHFVVIGEFKLELQSGNA